SPFPPANDARMRLGRPWHTSCKTAARREAGVHPDVLNTIHGDRQMKARVTATLLAMGFSAAVIAQEAPSFEEVDQNSDGMISQQEAAEVEGLDFATADRNQDGQLDRQEFQAATQQQQ